MDDETGLWGLVLWLALLALAVSPLVRACTAGHD